MSSGQMLLALGAIILLTKLALTTNSTFADNEIILLQGEAVTTGTSIGQSLLEKACVRQFDHNYPPGNDTVTAASFVSSSSLGIDSGELSGRDTTFNDIDDFRGFRDSVHTPRFGKFYLECNVHYVQETSPFDSTGIPTMMKKIEVKINNPYFVQPDNPYSLPGPIAVSRIIVYE